MEQLESRKIASRYAKAVLEAALEQGELEDVTDTMQQFRDLYKEVPELTVFFANPAVPMADKQDLVSNQLTKKGVSPIIRNLLNLIVENNRIEIFSEIVGCYLDLIRQREGVASAEVTVPVAIDKRLQNKLRSTLEEVFGYQQVDLTVNVDPAIIAGAIVRIGDKIIDGSYHGKLEMLRRQVG